MKKLILVLSVYLISLAASANFYPQPGYYTPINYNTWNQSYTSCHARTMCPNGRMIWCQTYGQNWGNVPSYMNNSCRFFVAPGRYVQCQGYVQQTDMYGRMIWAYVNIPVSCY